MTTHAQAQEAQTRAVLPAADLLTFGTDVALRSRWFVPASFQHPAKLHLGLLHWIIERYTKPGETIADPMAGSGSVLYAATLQRHVIAREIEPRWLALLQENAAHIITQAGLFAGSIDIGQADARELWGYQADHVIFSPPYGNEASRSPLAHRALKYQQLEGRRWKSLLARVEEQQGSWGSVMFHYGTHLLQIGHFRGKRYWQAMHLIYTQASASLRQRGYLILIVKDHIRDGKRVATAAMTLAMCQELGLELHAHHQRHLHTLSLW